MGLGYDIMLFSNRALFCRLARVCQWVSGPCGLQNRRRAIIIINRQVSNTSNTRRAIPIDYVIKINKFKKHSRRVLMWKTIVLIIITTAFKLSYVIRSVYYSHPGLMSTAPPPPSMLIYRCNTIRFILTRRYLIIFQL